GADGSARRHALCPPGQSWNQSSGAGFKKPAAVGPQAYAAAAPRVGELIVKNAPFAMNTDEETPAWDGFSPGCWLDKRPRRFRGIDERRRARVPRRVPEGRQSNSPLSDYRCLPGS